MDDAGDGGDRRSGAGRGAALLGVVGSGGPVAWAGDGHEGDGPSRSVESKWRIALEAGQVQDGPDDVVVIGIVVDAWDPEGIGRTGRGKGRRAREPDKQEEDE